MAKIIFTSRQLDSMKTDKIQEDFWDSKTPGMGLRVTSAGNKSWFLHYRINGRKRRYTFGTYPALPLHDARNLAMEFKRSIYMGTDPAQKTKALYFSELCEIYMIQHAKVQKKSWVEDERNLKRDVLPNLGSTPTHDITKKDIISLLNRISSRGVTIQANRTLALVRKIFNFGIEKGLIDTSPCLGIKKPHKEQSRDRVLSEMELRDILQAVVQLNSESYDLLRIILYTAQRSKEVKFMRWQDIDFRTGFWTIPGDFTKNGRIHRVPLSKTVLEVIKSRQAKRFESDWVFPSRCDIKKPYQAHQKAIQQLRKISKVEFRGHDFRRTAATIMASLGVQRTVLMKLLNHSEHSITTVYDRYSYDEEKKNALELWGNYLVDLNCDGEDTNKSLNRNAGSIS